MKGLTNRIICDKCKKNYWNDYMTNNESKVILSWNDTKPFDIMKGYQREYTICRSCSKKLEIWLESKN